MEPFEEKLKKYFDQVRPDGEFMDRLKALEGSPEAKPLPRGKPRRWVTPVAAGVAAALALGTGWAYLRDTLPGNAPEPTPAYSAPAADASAEPPEKPEPELSPPPAPSAETPEEPEPRAPAQAAPQPPAQKTPTPPPGQPEIFSGAPADPPETPPEADPPPMDPPPEPGSLPEDEPVHPEPENDPPKKPEVRPDPPEETPNETGSTPIIFAQYQATDSRETLTLSSLLTGQTAVIDVTGQLPPPKEPSQPGNPGEEAASAASESGEPSIYTGYCAAFGWQIRYTLVRDGADSVFAVAAAETPESERSLS